MACQSYIKEENVLFRAVLESTYGVDPGSGYKTIPVYRQFAPINGVEADEIDLQQATASQAPSPTSSARFRTSRTLEISAYGSGVSNAPPPWAEILIPISGFRQSLIAGSAPTLGSAAATQSTGGTLADGVYSFKVTHVDNDPDSANYRDETPASTAFTETVSAGSGTASIVLSDYPEAGAGNLTRIYATIGGGSIHYLLIEQDGAVDSNITVTDIFSNLDYSRVAPAAAGERVVYTPLDECIPSMTGFGYMQNHLREGNGERANMSWDWPAGDPGNFTFAVRGLYNATTAVALPKSLSVDPGAIPNFCGTQVRMWAGAGSTWYDDYGDGAGGANRSVALTPFTVKSLSGSVGREPTLRTDANADCSVREFVLPRSDGTISMTIEVPNPFKWDPVEDYKRQVHFALSGATVGPATSPTHKRVTFSAPKLQLAAVPTIGAGEAGIATYELTFRPLEKHGDDWLRWDLW